MGLLQQQGGSWAGCTGPSRRNATPSSEKLFQTRAAGRIFSGTEYLEQVTSGLNKSFTVLILLPANQILFYL